jgi:hypothetical protein
VRKLVIAALVMALLLALDQVAKSYAQSTVASAVEARVQGVSEVDADIDSFPFLGRLLVSGTVSELDLAFTDVKGHGIDVARLRIAATGIELDRGVLFGERHARIRDVDTVSARATITEAEIRRVSGADVRLVDGEATVSAAGVRATADVDVVDGRVQMKVGSLPAISVPVPDSELLPCEVQAKVVERALELSCTSHELPAIVIDAVGATRLER